MDRCNELCTQETTGHCRLCEALAERERFERFWVKGGLFIEMVRVLKIREIFAFFTSWSTPCFLCLGVLLLALIGYPLYQQLYQQYWTIPNQQIAMVNIAPEKRELTQKEMLDVQHSIRQNFGALLQTLIQAVGGAVLLWGLYFTYQTLRISQKTLRTNQETLRVTQEGQITERFTKAIEHLGDSRLAVCLGGIYALERIARDSDKDHWPIMEILTAYVRVNAPWPPKPPQPLEDNSTLESQTSPSPETSSKPETHIQAVLTVLGRRVRSSAREEGKWLELAQTDLRGVFLPIAHLEGAVLAYAHLEGARLSAAHLEGAVLAYAHLEGANLSAAHLEGAVLAYAHLERAALAGVHLEGARLNEAHLEGAYLGSAHLEGADLEKATLVGADLEKAILVEASLEGADLSRAYLAGAVLRDAHLEGATLNGAHLEGAFLRDAHLEGAVLRLAHLEGAIFDGACLAGADLRQAHLEETNLTTAQLVTVRTLYGARLHPNLKRELEHLAPHLFQDDPPMQA